MGWTLLVAFFLTVGGPPPQSAANAACLACHSQPDFKTDSGKNLHIDPSHFAASVHAGLPCTACHTSITGFPHPKNMAPVQCGTCHSSKATDVSESVHAKVGQVPCLDCHGNPHAIVPVTNPKSPVYPLNVPRTCGTCHGNPKIAKKYGFPNVYSMYVDSIHGVALTKDGLLVAASCSSCHGTHKILSRTNPKSPIYRTNIPDTCGKCHAGPKEQYLAGVHGQQMEAGNTKAPVCSTCHTAHRIVRVQQASWQTKSSATCGSCHKARYATYLDTFHAQVSALGYIEVAHCWNCHGNHDILPTSNPKSSVNPANLLHTCRQCHPSATQGFVSYQPHANPRKPRAYPGLWFTTEFMNLLLLSVLSFFFLHTILWFVRSMFDRQGRAAPKEVQE